MKSRDPESENAQVLRKTLLGTIESLSFDDKVWLKEKLDAMLQAEARHRFKEALAYSWSSNENFSEEEIEKDVTEAIREYREQQRGAGRS